MANLKHHMRLKCDRKQFQCDVCENLFNNYSVMVVHKRIHFGSRPYNCEDCWERFSCTSSLKSHYKWHKQHNLYFDENDESVTDLSSYELHTELNNCKLNNYQQIYFGKYLITIEATKYDFQEGRVVLSNNLSEHTDCSFLLCLNFSGTS